MLDGKIRTVKCCFQSTSCFYRRDLLII